MKRASETPIQAPSLAVKVGIGSGVLFREVDGESVLLHLDTGCYYGLDEVGTRAWTLLVEHGALRPVYERLLAEYEVAPERLESDLKQLVGELASRRLVTVDGL